MNLYTTSSGILKRKKQIEICLNNRVLKYKKNADIEAEAGFIGWGNKKNSSALKSKAKETHRQYWQLEDGFIGYLGHPSQKGIAVSLIADPIGIYYDASQPSQLESLAVMPLTQKEHNRASELLYQLKYVGVTKYNFYLNNGAHEDFPKDLQTQLQGQGFILLIDQVAGDLSLSGALADKTDFIRMLNTAKTYFPDKKIVIRGHPDTIKGKKVGVLANLPLDENVIYYNEASHPHVLIQAADAIFTVSSQMGFEALWFEKEVYCFGLPFYAGWGLTKDIKKCPRRNSHNISLEALIHATLIKYTTYFNPITEKKCAVEEVVNLIKWQQIDRKKYECLYFVGFSFWKRAFISRFFSNLTKRIKFVSQPPKCLLSEENIVIWGKKYPELEGVLRVEDGFIRSAGLGSNLCRPSSLIIDDMGIYFDSTHSNRLTHLLNNYLLNEKENEQAIILMDKLIVNDINKYHLDGSSTPLPKNIDQKIILVIGQVDGDASILYGSAVIKTNEDLLWAVRKQNPNAYIVYKPHPDVVSGNRTGVISPQCYELCVDQEVIHTRLYTLYSEIDELHTMTSLTGFEALLRKVPVVTWGQPFYSGWGLTVDQYPPNDRGKILSLESLYFITLIKYPLYFDWKTGLKISAEMLIDQMVKQKRSCIKQTKLQRLVLKLRYLYQTVI